MCMKIMINELEKINRRFEPRSTLKNEGSLSFAISHAARTKDWVKQLAYLLRALLVDHVFDDGNKRTATYLILSYFKEFADAFEALAEYDRTGKLPKVSYKKRIDVTIDPNLLRKIKEYCKKNNIKLSNLIENQLKTII